MDKIDYTKDYKEIYFPKTEPSIIDIPKMTYIMVDGKGDPNIKESEYQKSIEVLYALSYTIKMSKNSDYKIPGYIEYKVFPLEGLWWLTNDEFDLEKLLHNKSEFQFTSMIRQPDFVTEEVFNWAKEQVTKKKPDLDISKAYLKTIEEGLCVQIMHIGSYDNEITSINKIANFVKEKGYKEAISDIGKDGTIRRHHEIYISDPRKSKPESLKTVIRHPIK